MFIYPLTEWIPKPKTNTTYFSTKTTTDTSNINIKQLQCLSWNFTLLSAWSPQHAHYVPASLIRDITNLKDKFQVRKCHSKNEPFKRGILRQNYCEKRVS